MDVTATQPLAGLAAPATQAQETALSADFETFLVMLTAQMKNQDPLNPLDSQDFATQLATFSGVEQQVRTNDLITDLSNKLAGSNLGDMASWVGMEARMAVPAQFSGSPIELVPNPILAADRVELVVWNSSGAEVQRMPIPKDGETLTWAGVNAAGQAFPAGEYSFGVLSYSNDEIIDESVPETFTEISEVRLVDGEPVVALTTGTLYLASLVKGLR